LHRNAGALLTKPAPRQQYLKKLRPASQIFQGESAEISLIRTGNWKTPGGKHR